MECSRNGWGGGSLAVAVRPGEVWSLVAPPEPMGAGACVSGQALTAGGPAVTGRRLWVANRQDKQVFITGPVLRPGWVADPAWECHKAGKAGDLFHGRPRPSLPPERAQGQSAGCLYLLPPQGPWECVSGRRWDSGTLV